MDSRNQDFVNADGPEEANHCFLKQWNSLITILHAFKSFNKPSHGANFSTIRPENIAKTSNHTITCATFFSL